MRPALNTLPMGDLNAVDYVQEAHGRLFEASGSWQEGERVCGANPLSAVSWMELLTVDDHVGVAKVPGAPRRAAQRGAAPAGVTSWQTSS